MTPATTLAIIETMSAFGRKRRSGLRRSWMKSTGESIGILVRWDAATARGMTGWREHQAAFSIPSRGLSACTRKADIQMAGSPSSDGGPSATTVRLTRHSREH